MGEKQTGRGGWVGGEDKRKEEAEGKQAKGIESGARSSVQRGSVSLVDPLVLLTWRCCSCPVPCLVTGWR